MAGKITLNAQPNILDDYDLSTYHFRLYMLNPGNISRQNFKSKDGVILAESGVTADIYIDEVTIETVASMNHKVQNATSRTFNIGLKEFNGATFLDKILAATFDLDIQNYMDIPYYLELTFKGRDTDTGSPDLKVINNQKWVWPIRIQTVETTVNHGGASYEITAAYAGDLIFHDAYTYINKAIKIKANTVGEALTQLQDQLNKNFQKNTNTSKADSIVIDIDKNGDIAKFRCVDKDNTTCISNKTADPQKETTAGENEYREVEFANIKLIDAINQIITSTVEYLPHALNSNKDSTVTTDANKPKNLHRLTAETVYKEFDPARNVYQKEFRIMVLPYESGTAILDKSDTKANSVTRANNYINKRLIKKHYNYMFTGLNDQVIDVEIKFNASWAVNLPTNYGNKQQYSNKTEAQHICDDDKKETDKKTDKSKDLEAAPKTKSAEEIAEEEKKAQEAEEARQLIQQEAIEEGKKQTALENSRKTVIPPTNRFVTDYNINDYVYEHNRNIDLGRGVQRPITFIEYTPVEYADQVILNKDIESDRSTHKPYVNSLFQQAFSARSGDLVNLQLTIKGDPFWLSPAPINQNNDCHPEQKTFSTDPNAYTPSDHASNTTMAHNFFLFRLKTPRHPDKDTGVINNSRTSFDGLYAVKNITSTFSGGKFTQVLDATVEPLIDPSIFKGNND